MKRSFSSMVYQCFHEKKESVALLLAILLLFSVAMYTVSYKVTLEEQRVASYGIHNGCIFDISAEAIPKIEHHQSVLQSGSMTLYGNIIHPSGMEIGAVGCVDQNFIDFENISFLEGDYPSKENEIAMEYYLLDRLNIPYELGSEVILDIAQEDGSVLSKTYRLCGIMKAYTINWKSEGYPLASALVKNVEFDKIQQHLFFEGFYENIDQMNELRPLISQSATSLLCFNDYSYPAPDFSLVSLLSDGMAVLFSALICLLFLIGIQLSSIRKNLYRMRIMMTLGCDQKKLFAQLMRFRFVNWFRVTVTGLVCCFFITWILQLSLRDHVKVVWNGFPFLLASMFPFLIVLGGQVIQNLILKKMELLPKGKELAVSITRRKNPFRAKKPIRSCRELIGMERRRNIRYFLFQNGVILFSFTWILFCLFSICDQYRSYKGTVTTIGSDYEWSGLSDSDGLSEWQIAKIENLDTIDTVVYSSIVRYIHQDPVYVTYEGYMEDEYLSCFQRNVDYTESGLSEKELNDLQNQIEKENQENRKKGIPVSLVLIPDDSVLWDYYLQNETNIETFRQGKGVYLYLPDMVKDREGSFSLINVNHMNTYEGTDTIYSCDIKDNHPIELQAGNESLELTCLHVLRSTPGNQQTALDFLTPGAVLISEALYKKIVFNEDKDITYSMVMAFGNENMSYELTDKVMSGISKSSRVYFQNNRQEKEELKQNFLSNAFSLGTIGAVFFLISWLILYRNRQIFLFSERKRLLLLDRIGCSKEAIQSMINPRGLFFLWIVAAVMNLLLFSFTAYMNYRAFVSIESIYSMLKGVLTMESMNFPWFGYLAPQILYLSGVTCLISNS